MINSLMPINGRSKIQDITRITGEIPMETIDQGAAPTSHQEENIVVESGD